MVKMSAENMWDAFLSAPNDSAVKCESYSAWPFGANETQAKELAELVKAEDKTATSSLYLLYEMDDEPLPEVGEYNIITDWNGAAEVITKTTRVNIIPFNQVDETFARKEGEGDKSLDDWRKTHVEFFDNELVAMDKTFQEDMYVVCEEFQVVYP